MQLHGSRERCFHIHHLNNISQTCVCHTRARGDDARWHAEKRLALQQQRKHHAVRWQKSSLFNIIHYVIYARVRLIKTLWLMCRSNRACGFGLKTWLSRRWHPTRVGAAAHHRGHEEFLRERLSRWTAQPLLEARRHPLVEKVHRRPRHFQNVSKLQKWPVIKTPDF